jgi:hypothetical protein
MIGVDVPIRPYFGVATVLMIVALGVLYLFSEERPGNPTRA